MRFLVNGLSVTNTSGRHVLLGHLAGVAARTMARHEFVVLWHRGNGELVENLGANVTWRRCPDICRHWPGRTLWEMTALRRICALERVDAVFTPSGFAMPVGDLPQIVFCQNPWALVKGFPRSGMEHLKAALQRHGYRKAVRQATVMVFNSRFMEAAYAANALCHPRVGIIAYQGVDEDTFLAASASVGPRIPGQIVSVSAMASHKDVGTLLKAMAVLRDSQGVVARLKLVGAWPDRRYRESMCDLMGRLGLAGAVELLGHVSRADLHRLYAESSVFALFSRCESFGIPAVEAQAFGTPVVCADCCATREIEGEGGLFVAPGDHVAAAEALGLLLTQEHVHRELSARAKANAARFRWTNCTESLLHAFESCGDVRPSPPGGVG